jgi:DNA-binding response OmpR family regulator
MLTLRLALWDERPWTDLPTRLAKVSALRLVQEGPDAHLADGLLIIRRWPTDILLHRLTEVLAAARTPVLLCTAATSEVCAAALRLGVADIVRDDMHMAEVLARLALRCGAGRGVDGAQLAAGPLLLDRMQRMAWLHGRMLRLTPLQFDLLAALMQGAGQVVSNEALRHAVWHNMGDPGTNRIAVHIYHIRRALADAGGGVGVAAECGGYRLIL